MQRLTSVSIDCLQNRFVLNLGIKEYQPYREIHMRGSTKFCQRGPFFWLITGGRI